MPLLCQNELSTVVDEIKDMDKGMKDLQCGTVKFERLEARTPKQIRRFLVWWSDSRLGLHMVE